MGEVIPRDLRERDVEKGAAFGGTSGDDGEVRGREKHRPERAQHLRRGRQRSSVFAELLFACEGEGRVKDGVDLVAVAAEGEACAGVLGAEADQLPFTHAPERPSARKKVNSLKDIRFSLRVHAPEDVDSGSERYAGGGDVAPVFVGYGCDVHCE